jgi:hypothetical protein
MEEVILPGEDALLCRAVLSCELMKISRLLANATTEIDGVGKELTQECRLKLRDYSIRLQIALRSLGMDSSSVDSIVKDSSLSSP